MEVNSGRSWKNFRLFIPELCHSAAGKITPRRRLRLGLIAGSHNLVLIHQGRAILTSEKAQLVRYTVS